jgi:hypothetical protein
MFLPIRVSMFRPSGCRVGKLINGTALSYYSGGGYSGSKNTLLNIHSEPGGGGYRLMGQVKCN